jgi:hypothetical protein
MSQVRLRKESQTEIYFAHPYWSGWIFAMIGAGFGVLPWKTGAEPPVLWLFLGMSGLFTLLGIGAGFWRLELRLDLMARTYRRRRGFWPAVRTTMGSLDEIKAVILTRKWRSTGSSGSSSTQRVVWTVSLGFENQSDSVSISDSRNEQEAYRNLEHLAKSLHVDAIDRSGEQEKKTAWGDLDRSWVEAEESPIGSPGGLNIPTGSNGAVAPLPAGSGIECVDAPGLRHIVLPKNGFSGAVWAVIGFGLVFAGAGILALLSLAGVVGMEGAQKAKIGVGSVFTLFGFGLAAAVVWSSQAKWNLRESSDSLSIWLDGFGKKVRQSRLLKREIETIEIAESAASRSRGRTRVRRGRTTISVEGRRPRNPGRELTIRTDEEIVRLGSDLAVEELEWLRDAVRAMAQS